MSKHDMTVVPKGMIFVQGSLFSTCYVVKSGAVKTFHINRRGDEKVLNFYLPGEIFGFEGIMGSRHTCSAVALERSSLCRLSFPRLEELMPEVPTLQHWLLTSISNELNNAERMTRWLSQNSAEERVVGFVLDLADRFRHRQLNDTQFRLAMSRSDIANYLGLALETVSRILTRLNRDQVIDVHGRQIRILDKDRLRERLFPEDQNEAEIWHQRAVGQVP